MLTSNPYVISTTVRWKTLKCVPPKSRMGQAVKTYLMQCIRLGICVCRGASDVAKVLSRVTKPRLTLCDRAEDPNQKMEGLKDRKICTNINRLGHG